MNHKNFVSKPSWLPQPGTAERTIILKKLKRRLQRRGLTPDEIYNGLLQLTTSPQVLVTRWRARVLSNKKSNSPTNESECLSPRKKIEGDRVRDDAVAEAKNEVVEDIKTEEELSPPPKSKTPELLDEGVGGESHFFVKIPRKSISLNFHALEAPCTKNNRKESKTCTQISVADSSVSGHENPTDYSVSGVSDEKKGAVKSKKLTIVEDVTFLEGTILTGRTFLKTSTAMIDPTEEQQMEEIKEEKQVENEIKEEKQVENEIKDEKQAEIEIQEEKQMEIEVQEERQMEIEILEEKRMEIEIREEKLTSIVSTFMESKRRARPISRLSNKLRIRRRFRQLFGSDLTSSELDEEDDIIERFLRMSKRKKVRNSSDSGVGLTELVSEDTFISESDSEQHVSSEEPAQSGPKVITISDVHEEKDKPVAPLRSMPLLDSSPSPSDMKEQIIAEALPDSTNSSKDSVVQADSSVHEPTNHQGKLTILVTPANASSPDTFSPVRLEIDIPYNNQTSTPTLTTEHRSEISSKENAEKDEHTKANDRVKINITKDGEYKVVLSPRHTKNEEILIDSSGNQSGVTVMIAQDFASQGNEKISLYQGFEDITPVSSPGAMAGDPEKSKSPPGVMPPDPGRSNTDGQRRENDKERVKNEAPVQPQASPPVPSLPKLRVRRPSELGSRWCPTPLPDIAPSAQNMSVSSDSHRFKPIFPNPYPRNNATVASVQPAQPTLNIPRMPGRINTERTTRTLTSHKNLPNNINCSQQGCPQPQQGYPGPSFVPREQPILRGTSISASLALIYQLLESLNTCVELNKTTYNPSDAVALQNRFIIEKHMLCDKIAKLRQDTGIFDYNQLIDNILYFFEKKHVFKGGNLSREKILYILHPKSLPVMQLESPMNLETQTRYDHVASQPLIRPPPPLYQAFPTTSYVPQGPSSSASSHTPLFSPNQHTRPGISRALPFANPYLFTQSQLTTLHYQISMYYKLHFIIKRLTEAEHRVQSQQKLAETRRSQTEGNTTLQIWPSPIENVPQLPVLLNLLSSVSPPVQNNLARAPTESNLQPPNIARSEKTINDSANNGAGLTQERHHKSVDRVSRNITETVKKINETSKNEAIAKEAWRYRESIQEVLKTMALISQPTIDCSTTDNNNNTNEQGTKTQRPGSLSVPEVPLSLEAMEESETSSQIDQRTKTQTPRSLSVPENLLSPEAMEESETSSQIDQRTNTQTPRSLLVPEISLSPEAMEENETSSQIDQRTNTQTPRSLSVPEISLSPEAMEDSETSSQMEERSPDNNEIEDNDELESPSSCEPNLVIDEPDIVEMETSSLDSVITQQEDSKLKDKEITSFSILEVKSISKDIFDNMDNIEEESAEPTSPEASQDAKEDYDDSTTNSDLRNCLRCGEPSSVVCEQCYEAFYCSSECHEAHWTEHHYLICKPVPAEALAKF
ncbi:uncharacterized protein [Venturia canescens]|uniref:uncharacterized protein n=1 Tax=Venturia canescens TaxID=32260 RepID=UPI001C9BCE9D|nr:uncharacterized protein LOC122409364 [Venturia canescens]XP_043272797.1 uncharacterized protein LOC122409364 [Venturia canescens]